MLMEWIQVATIVISVTLSSFGMWLWSRREARTDARHMDLRIDANRRETASLIKEIRDDGKKFSEAMQKLDARHLILEERYLKLREKE